MARHSCWSVNPRALHHAHGSICWALQDQPATASGVQQFHVTTLGDQALMQRGFTTPGWWYWLAVGVIIGFTLIFNCIIIWAHTRLGRTSQ